MQTSQENPDHKAEATQYQMSQAIRFPPETEPALRLLQQYSGVRPEQIPELVGRIQARALAIFHYGCFKSFWFLNLVPTLEDPRYQVALERLRAPEAADTFLDVGCCLGPVVRQLASQGVPDDRLYGTDLHAGFLELGHELFGDRDRSRATYVAGDMLDENDARLDVLRGKIDIIYASAFFHLFEREGQLKAAKRMVGFLRADSPDVMIFGQNQGPKVEGWEKYVLDPGAWAELWEEVGQATGTRWRTEMEVESTDDWNNVRFGVYRER
ncbi:porphobilinogen deaminase protein [Apiospora marii]|uniref:porphobilinogen deaminase protein n=1 Tax=Apiospora marii TaxID=335849 RepID=UPI00313175AB